MLNCARRFCFFLVISCLFACDKNPPAGHSETPASAVSTKATANEEVVATAIKPSVNELEGAEPSQHVKTLKQDLHALKQKYAGMVFFVADVSERSYDDGSAIAVTFSVPVDASKNFSSQLSVTSPDGPVPGSWVLSESGTTAYFENVQPSSQYDVAVHWQLQSVNGDNLGASHNGSVSIRATEPSVSFATTSRFLPVDLHSGLPVTTLNVPEVDIDFHRVPNKAVAKLMGNIGNQSELYQYTLQKVVATADYVYSGRFELSREVNKRRTVNIPLHNIQAIREPGVYLAIMNEPGTYKNAFKVTYFMVTDIGLHARIYGKELHIHANSLTTSQALTSVALSITDHNGVEVASGRTDKQGVSVITGMKSSMRYLLASYKDSYSVLDLRGPALDLSDFQTAQRVFKPYETFIYSERDLYRPGDTINFNALLRNYDGQLARGFPLKARLLSGDGKLATSFTWHANALGYYTRAYQLSASAKTGNWQLELRGINKQVETYTFKVEEFIPERLKLTFNPNSKPTLFSVSESVQVDLQGDYLYGAPAAGNQFDASIRVSVDQHPFEAFKAFNFGDGQQQQWNSRFDIQRMNLADDGSGQIDLGARWSSAKTPLRLTIFGSLYESGGRPTSRYHHVSVLPKAALVGVRPHFDKRVDANSDAVFDFVKTAGLVVEDVASTLELRLIKKDRQYYWQHNRSRGWHYEYSEKEFPVFTSTETLQAGKLTVKLPVDYGHYRLEVIDTETQLQTSFEFQAGEDWYAWWRDANQGSNLIRPDKVSLALDKAHYTVGDTAKLTIVPPAAGQAIVKVEADTLLWSTRIEVSPKGQVVDIPIAEEWKRHDIYISVLHIQPAVNKEKITPDRAMGLVHLPLERKHRALDVAFNTPEKWLPNQRVSFDVTLSPATQPNTRLKKKAWITVAAVDMGILNITDYQRPDPNTFFFGQRRYQVDAVDMYNQIIELNNNRLAALRFGGDAGALSRGGKNAKSEVQIVSLFSGLVEVNNGQATLDFELPDFNGRVKLMAVAFTDNAFGSAEAEVTVAAPLVTQLSLPRFVAWGDSASMALDLNNISGKEQTLALRLSASPPLKLDALEQTITLADKNKKTLLIPFDVLPSESQSTVSLSITGVDGYPIERQWQLNARAPYPAITRQKNSQLKPQQSLSISTEELANLIPASVEMSISASNVVDLQPAEQLQGLLRYPYGCLEQSTSSTYPWVYADERYLAELGIKNTTNKSQLENFSKGLALIAEKQKSNGGFGLWSSDSSVEEHWLTVYAADFFTDAKEQGFALENDFYNKTIARLKTYLQSNYGYAARWSENPDHYKFAYRAYAGFVLSRMGQAKLGHLRSLAKQRDQAASRLALVHLALALKNQGDNKLADEVMSDAMQKPLREAGYLGDYGSAIRDRALIIRALLKNDYATQHVMTMAVQLAGDLKRRRYLSTQERNALFMASVELSKDSGNTWQASLAFADAQETIRLSGHYSRFLEGEQVTNGVTLANQHDDDLFASIRFVGHQLTRPEPVSDLGLNIARSYYNRKGEKISPNQLNVGDMVLVRIQLASERRRPDLMVIDLLPAGLELENQNLKHSASLDDWRVADKTVGQWREQTTLVHQEFRDDRFVAALSLGWQGRAELFYLARAVTPGTYKVPAPFVEDMYDPEVYALGETLPSIHIK